MNVIDVGCKTYGKADSVVALIKHFKPEELHGFDPGLPIGSDFVHDGTRVHLLPYAAWRRSGHVRLIEDGSRSNIEESSLLGKPVLAVDLAEVVMDFKEPVVLKLDCEGGEYVLIAHLIETGAYKNVSQWLVEWHGDPLSDLPFEWEPWWM